VEEVKDVIPDIEKKIAIGEAPPKSKIIKAAKAKTKKEKRAILAGKEPSPPAPAPLPELPLRKNGQEVWPLKDRKKAQRAFGEFVRLIDKTPVWNRAKGPIEVLAKLLNPATESEVAA
jgi:hypothetical protein